MRGLYGLRGPLRMGEGGQYLTTQYLLEEQVDRVLAALTRENELVCRVSLRTGLRVSDVLALKP